jgi:hypothetical protein
MTRAPDHKDRSEHVLRGPRRQSSLPVNRRAAPAALAALLGLTVLAAGCGGSNIPGPAGPGPNKTNRTSTLAQGLAYAQCVRGHGVANFPDPSAPPGGGVAFQVHGGPNSDLSPGNPTFRAADQACRSLLPTAAEAPPPSAQKLAAELRWARCMSSHGLPSFPDPNAQGAFDSSRFNDSSPTFQTANKACASLQPTGPMSAVPGHGP